MDFCENCGAWIEGRNKDFALECKKCSHIEVDRLCEEKREIRKRIQGEKEKNRTIALTSFLDPNEILIFRLLMPEVYRKEQRETGKLLNQSKTFPFYEYIKKLEESSKPYEFYYDRGNPLSKKQFKDGLIFIKKDLVSYYVEKIESFELIDGEHFRLQQVILSEEERTERIKEIERKMKERVK